MKGQFIGVSAPKPSENGKSYKSIHLLMNYDIGTGSGQFPKSYSVEASFPISVKPGDSVVFYERYYGTTRNGQPMVGLEVLEKNLSD